MIKYNKILVILILLFCLIILFACGEATVSPVSSIVITNLPQTEYFLGDDLNLNDAQVTVIYDNNSSTIIPITREMISGFDSNVVGKQTLTVTYENVYSFFTVNVTYPPIYSISFVNTENYKKNYVVGESLDINNLFIIANYSNGYTSKVNVTNEMISGFDSSIIGTKTLSITYSGKVCSFSIDVNEKIIVNTQLVAPTKNSYVVGDILDLTGGKIFIAYNDNSHVYLDLKVLDDNNEITINCLNFENDFRRFKNDMLTTSVNVLYKTFSFSFNVTVSQLKISSVDIKKYPDDLIVYQKNIDVSSGIITVVYNNSTSKDMNLDDECIILDLSNIDINSINIVDGYNFEIKVLVNPNNPNNYVSKECNVKVVQSTPEELIIIPSTTLKFYQGTNLDFSTWKYKIKLNNDQFNILPSSKTDEDFVSNEMVDLNNINVNKVGKQIVRFVYVLSNNSRLVKDVEIEILQKTITNIYVSTNYNHVYEQGDAFNFSSLLLNVEYNDNTIEENISVTIDMLKDRNQIQIESLTDLTNEVSSRDFNNYLFISYQDNRFNISSDVAFEYIVVKKCINIELRNEPEKKYVLNSDFLFDWEVYVEYIDGTGDFFTQDDLKDSIWTFENIDFSSINTYQVKLIYAHSKFIEYEINVTNNIILEGFKDSFIGFINEGANINSNTLLYDVLEDLSVKESTISLFDFTYVPDNNGTLITNNVTFSKAFIKTEAKYDYYNNLFGSTFNNYYIYDNENFIINNNPQYDFNIDYYIYIPEIYKNNWKDVWFNFYIYDSINGQYVIANNIYDSNTTYYIQNENVITVTNNYNEYSCFIRQRKFINNVEIIGYNNQYDQATINDLTDSFILDVHFNNNTSVLVNNSNIEIDKYIISQFNYSYNIKVVNFDNGEKTYTSLSELTLDSENYFTDLTIIIELIDEITGYIYRSNEISILYFKKIVNDINILIGTYDGTTFTQFNNIDIFINQNKDLFYDDNSIIKSNAFVINNDIKSYIHDSLFFNLQFDDSSEIVSFNDAFKYFIFDIDCIDTSNPGIFTFDFEYLTFALNFAITVRANIIQSIEVKSSDNTNSIVFKEGIELDSLNINILASFNDADNNPIEAKTIIDIKDVLVSNYSKNEIYEFSNEHMDANGQFIERVINFSYLGKSSSLNAKIYKKALERLVLKVIPKKIYIEQEDTDIDFTGGIVTIEYDNGYKFDKDLTSLDLIKDVSQFSTNVELNNGSRKEYSIKISYTDGEYTRYTNYVVYVVDRKYIEIEYSDSVNNILNFEYESSDINNRPEFLIKYYTNIESNIQENMELDNPNLKIYYLDATTNQIVKENDIPVSWPENVGSYILCVEFLGDAINNPFISKFYTINITKKILNIVIDDIDLIYGNIYQTLNYKNLGLNISLFDSLENDYSSIYNSLVTSENFVLYRDVTKNNIVEFGHYPEVAPVMTAINLDYGTYLLETIVTIDNDANYTLNKLTIDSNINVVKRSIKVYANEKIKQYGDEDPLFDFYVEDNTTSGLNNNVSLIGDNNTISFKYNDNIIFTDSQISLYRLIRDTSIANQAVNLEGYPILSGQSYDVPNYDVEYISNVIKITKSNLFVEIKDNIISNDFGTINISFDYLITNSKYQDNTASLLYDYLSNPIAYYDSDLDKVIYVNEITSNNINTIDYCLIKNLRSNNYPVEFNILSGTNYLMIPISTIAGTYDLVLNDISVVLSNYNVLYSNDNVSLVVNPIRVNVNIISKFVSEKTFKDTNNNYVYNHFAYPGINFSFNEINETNLLIGNNAITPGIFAREDININYDIQNYILSDNFILDNLHLTSDTCVGGINGVTCEYNSLSEYKDSFLISFTSMYSDNMSYIDYYFSILNENLFSGQLSNNFVENYNLYYIYIPSLIDLNVSYSNDSIQHFETYDYKLKELFNVYLLARTDPNSDYSLFNENYSFALLNSDSSVITSMILESGEYIVNLTYDYFDSLYKKYIYLGDKSAIENSLIKQLVEYYFNNKQSSYLITKSFDYSIKPIVLNVSIENNSVSYNNDNNEINIANINLNGNILNNDNNFILSFDIQALMYETNNLFEYENVGLNNKYSIFNNDSLLDVHEFEDDYSNINLINSGTYTITINSLGNLNYTINSNSNIAATIVIQPNIIPVYLAKEEDSYSGMNGLVVQDGNELTIKVKYSGNVPSFDQKWIAAKNSELFLYYTMHFAVVKSYYDSPLDLQNAHNIVLTEKPKFSVNPVDDMGNIPINSTPSGYNFKALFENDEFINYQVKFVYKVNDHGDDKFVVVNEDNYYKYYIQPTEVKLYKFYDYNFKTYNAQNAKISENNNMFFDTNKISVSDIVFTFYRLDKEGSTKIGGVDFVSINDLKSAGEFAVTAYVNDNYKILFNENASIDLVNEHSEYLGIGNNKQISFSQLNEYAIYTIEREDITIELNNSQECFINKEYNSLSMNENYDPVNNHVLINTFANSNIHIREDILDDKTAMYVYYEALKYSHEYNNSTLYDIINDTYDVGYYLFNIYFGFFDNQTSETVLYKDISSSYSNLLNWNYIFTVNNSYIYDNLEISSGIYADGYYQIKQKDIYFVLGQKIGEQFIGQNPSLDLNKYTYYIEYSGNVYTTNNIEIFDFNSNPSLGKEFNYAYKLKFYDENTDSFIDIDEYRVFDEYILTYNSFVFNMSAWDAAGIQYYYPNADQYISIDLNIANPSSFANMNKNYNLVFSTIYIKIKQFEVNASLEFINRTDNTNSIVYKGTDRIEIVFTIDENVIIPGLTHQQFLTENIYKTLNETLNGSFIFNNSISFSFGSDIIKEEDGTRFYLNNNSLKRLIVNEYEIDTTTLIQATNKYSLKLNISNFNVIKKEILITGIDRDYFVKGPSNYYIHTDIDSNNELRSDINNYLVNIASYIIDNTLIISPIGTYDSNNLDNYYVSISNNDLDSATLNNNFSFTITSTVNKSDAYNKYIPLTINRRLITLNINLRDISYGTILRNNNLTSSDVERFDGFTFIDTSLPVLSYSYIENGIQKTETFNNDYISEQNIYKTEIRNLINYDSIIYDIAFYDVNSYIISLDNYLINSNQSSIINENDNFEFSLSNIQYNIIKKYVNIQMNPNHIILDGEETFTFLWNEWSSKDTVGGVKYKYKQSDDTLYSFNVYINNFDLPIYTVEDGLVYSNINDIENKLLKIFNITKDNDIYYYNNQSYSSIENLVNDNFFENNFIIIDSNNSDSDGNNLIETQEIGKRYIRIKSLNTNNFAFSYICSTVLLFPEINYIGNEIEYVHNDEDGINYYINDTVCYNSTSPNNIYIDNENYLNNIMINIPITYFGILSKPTQNFFTNLNYGSQTYFASMMPGITINNNLYQLSYKIKYLDGANDINNIEIGDVLLVQIYIYETFFAININGNDSDKKVNTFVSIPFRIKIISSETLSNNANELKINNVVNTSNTELENGEYNTIINNNSILNVKDINSSNKLFNYNILSIKEKMYDSAINSSLQINIYENDFGSLSFYAFNLEQSYYELRMTYKQNNYLFKNSSKIALSGITYYSIIDDPNKIIGDNIISDSYIQLSNGTLVKAEGVYFNGLSYKIIQEEIVSVGTNIENQNYYVNYYSSKLNENIINLFDNINHLLTFYINTNPNITNVSFYYDSISDSKLYLGQSTSTIYVNIDGVIFPLSYSSGAYYNYNLNSYSIDLFDYLGRVSIINTNARINIISLSLSNSIISTYNNFLIDLAMIPSNNMELSNSNIVIKRSDIPEIFRYSLNNGDAYNNVYTSGLLLNDINSIISITIEFTNSKGNSDNVSLNNIPSEGFYCLKYTLTYNDNLSSNSFVLATQTYNVFVIDEPTYFTLHESDNNYTFLGSNPIGLLNNKTYISDSFNNTTYLQELILDNINTTNLTNNNIELIFRTTNTNILNLSNADYNEGTAFGLRIQNNNGVYSSRLFIIDYVDTEGAEDVIYQSYENNNIDYSLSNTKYIIKIEYGKYDENFDYITFRLYQYNKTTNISSLIWEQIISSSSNFFYRNNDGSSNTFMHIPNNIIYKLLSNNTCYTKISLLNSTITIDNIDLNNKHNNFFDIVNLHNIINKDGESFVYTNNYSSINSGSLSPITYNASAQNNLTFYNDTYYISDKYNTPYGTTYDSFIFEFSGDASGSNSYDIMFSLNMLASTPYFASYVDLNNVYNNKYNEENYSTYTRERGIIIDFYTDSIQIYIDEYNIYKMSISNYNSKLFWYKSINNYFDGNKHSVLFTLYNDIEYKDYDMFDDSTYSSFIDKLEYYDLGFYYGTLVFDYDYNNVITFPIPKYNNYSKNGNMYNLYTNNGYFKIDNDAYFLNKVFYTSIINCADIDLNIDNFVFFNNYMD